MAGAYNLVTDTNLEPHGDAKIDVERPWQTGIWRRAPWTGLLALVVGLGCDITALSVALIFDGKPLDHWSVRGYILQPTVVLSLLVTLTNVSLSWAFSSGLVIHWWSGALQGRSLRYLHTSYS